jgi:nicotinamide-nucleotide amidase
MRLRLLLTGNELMAGDIIDSNSAMIAATIVPLGWQIEQKVTVGDQLTLLCEQIDSLCESADVLLINGGLGPTVDDLTAQALAQVTGVDICEHPQALQHLQHWCKRLGFSLSAANRKQAMLPRHCDIIDNTRGSAVGIRLVHKGCMVLATPGVPSELKYMLDDCIIPLLQSQFESDKIRIHRLGSFGLGESSIQQRITEQLPDWPADIDLGFRASMPVLEVKLSASNAISDDTLNYWHQRVAALLEDHLLGDIPISLPESLIQALRQNGKTLCTAESCTGGLIASQITSVAGASDVFPGGVVSYSNTLKQQLLGVSASSLELHGAVSQEVVLEMARGALAKTGADTVLAVTGIAGPTGGTNEKPVGTVWISWGDTQQLQSMQFTLAFERHNFQMWAAAIAMDLLRRQLLKLSPIASLAQRFKA